MKTFKQIITVVALAIFMLSSFNGNAQTKKIAKIKLHIEIGRVKKGCNGFWFCKGSTLDVEVGMKAEGNNNDPDQALLVMNEKSKGKNVTLYLKNLQGKKFNGFFNGEGEENVTIPGVGTIIAKKYILKKELNKMYKKQGYNYSVELDLK